MWRFRLWAGARVGSKNKLLKYLADRFVLGGSRQGLPAFVPRDKKEEGGGEGEWKWGFVAVSFPRALAMLGAVGVVVVGVGVAWAVWGSDGKGGRRRWWR